MIIKEKVRFLQTLTTTTSTTTSTTTTATTTTITATIATTTTTTTTTTTGMKVYSNSISSIKILWKNTIFLGNNSLS